MHTAFFLPPWFQWSSLFVFSGAKRLEPLDSCGAVFSWREFKESPLYRGEPRTGHWESRRGSRTTFQVGPSINFHTEFLFSKRTKIINRKNWWSNAAPFAVLMPTTPVWRPVLWPTVRMTSPSGGLPSFQARPPQCWTTKKERPSITRWGPEMCYSD